MKIKDVPGIGLLLPLTLFTVMGCAQALYLERAEPPLEAIQRADELREKGQILSDMGLIETPDGEWFDVEHAYYLALNVAWAYGDEEEMEYFMGRIEDLYQELIEDENLILPNDYESPLGQEL